MVLRNLPTNRRKDYLEVLIHQFLIHWQCYTNGSVVGNGGRDARDPRILTFAKKYGCTQPYLNFSFRPVNGYINSRLALSLKHFTTGKAGGYMTDGALESTHQPVQPLGGSYCDFIP